MIAGVCAAAAGVAGCGGDDGGDDTDDSGGGPGSVEVADGDVASEDSMAGFTGVWEVPGTGSFEGSWVRVLTVGADGHAVYSSEGCTSCPYEGVLQLDDAGGLYGQLVSTRDGDRLDFDLTYDEGSDTLVSRHDTDDGEPSETVYVRGPQIDPQHAAIVGVWLPADSGAGEATAARISISAHGRVSYAADATCDAYHGELVIGEDNTHLAVVESNDARDGCPDLQLDVSYNEADDTLVVGEPATVFAPFA